MSYEDIAKLTAPLVLDPGLFALTEEDDTLIGDGPMVEGNKDTADIGYRSDAQATAGWNDYQVMMLGGTLILTAGTHVILLETLTMPKGTYLEPEPHYFIASCRVVANQVWYYSMCRVTV